MTHYTQQITSVKELAKILQRSSAVGKFDSATEPQAWTLADALHDIEESFSRIVNTEIPRLLNTEADSLEVDDTLHSLGEEMRHILYHLKDAKYFAYIHEE